MAARAQSEEDRRRLHEFEDEARRHAAEAVGEIAELEARVANLTAEATRARGGGGGQKHFARRDLSLFSSLFFLFCLSSLLSIFGSPVLPTLPPRLYVVTPVC